MKEGVVLEYLVHETLSIINSIVDYGDENKI